MRTTLLVPLILLSVGCSLVSLLVIRVIVERQITASLASDLQHSVRTYQNLQHQRREVLSRESALLADLPPLKALMTAGDVRTIEDGGTEFWQLSGSDLFALLDPGGKLIALYTRGPALDRTLVERQLERSARAPEPALLTLGDRLYEVALEPLWFGSSASGTQLGSVAVGYAIDTQVAREVSEAAAADVAFVVDGRVVVSTLKPELQQQLATQAGALSGLTNTDRRIRLGGEDYLVASASVAAGQPEHGAVAVPRLVVLKSFQQASQLVHEVNRWVLTLALLTLLVGIGIFISISRTLTHPLAVLLGGTRALAKGNFDYQLSEGGVEEIRELSRAFERMRVELRHTQAELIDSERLATIGRMASSISHDLRHYLSAAYANAEFLSDGKIPQSERDDLMEEVRMAVQGMTDLLDSLLLFTQTGRALYPEYQSLDAVVESAASMVRSHPASRDVKIVLNGLAPLMAWIDAKKLGRAVYNILLNGCQAARRGSGPPTVTLSLLVGEMSIRIQIADNGPGVPEAIRQSIFLPFVSQGRESGVGLGLTLAQQIAQEHGGSIELSEASGPGAVFTIVLPKSALRKPENGPEKKTERIQAHTYR
ncbi:sensor histidine kinase [Edaphobacter bradus]|uniref:sensor histidine kinase n=1 Tax=Edaphobacter bradus TaxID=2259016 RepID=UPI0021DFE786|nr:HAMP domain-containing sensor histidine kinase [Edaphobacter bradus]